MQPMGQVGNNASLGGVYGAFPEVNKRGPSMLVRSQRQRLNMLSVCYSLFVPWVFFCLVYAASAFSLHYSHPAVVYLINFVSLVTVLVIGGFALSAAFAKQRNPEAHEPSWLVFMFVTMLVSFVLGVVLGDLNFSTYMQPYYDYTNLNDYYFVDPARMRGQQLMDTARAYFVNGTTLDLQRSMGFKNMDTYCVAPISAAGQPLASYDFWAVGLNCCTGNMADFACGEYNNPDAKGGLRLLRDDQRAFFRLAVQQAEAAYNIKSVHPLFFYWSQDPVAEMEFFRDEGTKYYMVGMMAHFAWQAFAVGLAAMGFGKLGHFGY